MSFKQNPMDVLNGTTNNQNNSVQKLKNIVSQSQENGKQKLEGKDSSKEKKENPVEKFKLEMARKLTKEVKIGIGKSVEKELGNTFTGPEKGNITEVMFNNFFDKIDFKKINNHIKKNKNIIISNAQEFLSNFDSEKLYTDKQMESFKILFGEQEAQDMLDLANKFTKDLKKLKTMKEKNPKIKFKDYESVINALDMEGKTNEQVTKENKDIAGDLLKKISFKKLDTDEIKGEIDSQLKEGKSENSTNSVFAEWIRNLAKTSPFWGGLLAIIFGVDISDKGGSDKEKSTKNLQKTIAKKEKEGKKIPISIEQLKELKPDQLKGFYEFLKSKNIDYSKDNFWEELFNENTKDTKIQYIQSLLKDSKTGKMFEEDMTIKDFTKKLNSLGKIEYDKETKTIKDKLGQQVVNSGKKTIPLNPAGLRSINK